MLHLLKVGHSWNCEMSATSDFVLSAQVHWQVPYPILVSAYTNTACDNLADGMRKRGLKVLRYGSRSRIREDLKESTLDWYLEQHPHKKNLDLMKAATYKTPKGKFWSHPESLESLIIKHYIRRSSERNSQTQGLWDRTTDDA
jgi:hypothetical protein